MITIRCHSQQISSDNSIVRFEAREAGGPVSLFLVNAAPGQSSSLHKHPYMETWIVRHGKVAFIVGDQEAVAQIGDIVVAPAEVPHRWTNIGNDKLELICIHPSDTILQSPATSHNR
ncbi:cupin domain-containing protein [Ochrobactrum sp. RH2CCR150]|uniref:cupin domain-containing protein n=1 Tax=Ochrobactrum sp. RH2CCR150 TaxID=2587044 RepID=UPI0015FDB014|nr:quercetin dioxygenase-like cupin family protein [Ochrobactrum sp. RH2CCR150]